MGGGQNVYVGKVTCIFCPLEILEEGVENPRGARQLPRTVRQNYFLSQFFLIEFPITFVEFSAFLRVVLTEFRMPRKILGVEPKRV